MLHLQVETSPRPLKWSRSQVEQVTAAAGAAKGKRRAGRKENGPSKNCRRSDGALVVVLKRGGLFQDTKLAPEQLTLPNLLLKRKKTRERERTPVFLEAFIVMAE